MNEGDQRGTITCPSRTPEQDVVLLAHGGGGRLTNGLIENLFIPAFSNPALDERHDGAFLGRIGAPVAFTTDSYVVQPLFFPGGDIGSLAVNGTINDLAMCGARPVALSVGLIIEEGLRIETLRRIVQSIGETARRAGVSIVTGDTKVIDAGKGDEIFVNTSGLGAVEAIRQIGPSRIAAGDAVIVSGDLGRHGTAIMALREGLRFESAIQSDTASLWPPVHALLEGQVDVHCLRDLTRGGLATSLVEVASLNTGADLMIEDAMIPVSEPVRGACEMLGLDPLYVANEGRFVCFVPGDQATLALEILRGCPETQGAARIGTVEPAGSGLVIIRTRIGTRRVVEMFSGEQLPRIC
jgi:hydrogenase expression/formation protein HypE